MEESVPELFDLPGFRFHPTEEELVNFYLRNTVSGIKLHFQVIGFLNIYQHHPSDLPGLAEIGEREWYFFVPRDRKNGNGGRPNRTTKHGYWKATGSDRKILSSSDPKWTIGLKKTLVFYNGRAPRGSKTDWVMNEYRLPDSFPSPKDIVLCKIYRKATSLKVLEQRAAMDEEVVAAVEEEGINKTFHALVEHSLPLPIADEHVVLKKEHEELVLIVEEKKNQEAEEEIIKGSSSSTNSSSSSALQLPSKLPELQLPKLTMDWFHDPCWTQLRSPWLDNLSPYYANILNF